MSDKLIIGHYTKKSGWVQDASMSTTVNAGQNYTLGITLKGTTVSATLSNANGGFQAVVGHSFNASGVDGNFGLLAVSGTASFDDVRVKTNDRAFVQPAGGANLLAAEPELMTDSASTVTQADLHSAVTDAMLTWTEMLGDGDARLAGFGDVQITLGDLAGDALGYTEGRRIWIDRNAAGYGWSSDGRHDGSGHGRDARARARARLRARGRRRDGRAPGGRRDAACSRRRASTPTRMRRSATRSC